jgi:ornithine cyclodeaminase/alanine dehydrogenase
MLVLTRAEVASLLDMAATIDALEEGFRQLALGNVVMPQRAATSIGPHNGLHLSMPAFVGGADEEPGTLSIKIVTVYGDNPAKHGLPTIQGVILLHDARTGSPLALMDAEDVTAMRTGAVGGLAARYLAREDAKRVTLFGAGALAPGQLEAMCVVRPIEEALVVTRTGDKDGEFCAHMADKLGIEIAATRDVAGAVESADIICTATNSQTPLFDGELVQPGTHISAVGAYHTGMRELDTTTIRRGRVFVDHHEAAQSEAGDIMIPVHGGEISYGHVAGDLGALVMGDVIGRSSRSEITVFKSVGLAMQDAVTVQRIYEAAMAQGVGREIEL